MISSVVSIRGGVFQIDEAWVDPHRIFIFDEREEAETWVLYIFNMAQRTYCCLDPLFDRMDDASEIKNGRFNVINESLCRSVSAKIGAHECWAYQRYESVYTNAFMNKLYSGIIIATAAYFILFECPVYFEEKDIEKYRTFWAYWFLKGTLPV